MVKVHTDKPSQRRHHRVSAPLTVTIGERVYSAMDWSLGGYRLQGYHEKVEIGDIIESDLSIPFQDFNVSFHVKSEVVFVVKERDEIAVKFQELGKRQKNILSHFLDELIRGFMTPVEDTIERIDTPVTPAPTTPDAVVGPQTPLRRRRLRSFVMIAFYIVAGIGLSTYFSTIIYANLFRIEVDSAVVAAPVEAISSAIDGRVQRLHVALNAEVERGTLLVTLEDARLEQAIDLANVGIGRAREELITIQRELVAEREALVDYESIAYNRIEQSMTDVEALEQQALAVRSKVNRLTSLFAEGWLPKSVLEEAVAELAAANSRVEKADVVVREKIELLEAVRDGRFFDGDKFVGRLTELEAAEERAKKEIELATEELLAMYAHKNRLTLSAPDDGRLVRLLKAEGNGVRRGEGVLLPATPSAG
ncbi:MAG: biotin/lipoyl-binding protein [Alphaproteobacteria bacterium]|jgi:multidrug resistance efflux pump|nr:biotin/lipoyl-binding protein [Alphaproteobacteria bacterium]